MQNAPARPCGGGRGMPRPIKHFGARYFCKAGRSGTMNYRKFTMTLDTLAIHIRPGGVVHQVIEAVPNAVVVLNRNNQIVLINARAELVFGYGETEILGCPI